LVFAERKLEEEGDLKKNIDFLITVTYNKISSEFKSFFNYKIGEAAYFWTSTVNGSAAYAYGMFNYDGKTSGGYISKQIGMSVRCIKD